MAPPLASGERCRPPGGLELREAVFLRVYDTHLLARFPVVFLVSNFPQLARFLDL